MDFFDFVAPLYDRIFPIDRKDLCGLIEVPTGGWLLDIGGGTGRVSGLFSRKEGLIVVVDVSYRMLLQVRMKIGLHPVCAQAENLPFKAEEFTRIIMVDTLHHIKDQERGLSEARRVLAEKGRLIIKEPDIDKPSVKVIAFLEKILLMQSRFLSKKQLDEIFNKLLFHTEFVSYGLFNCFLLQKLRWD
ncbi:MAG TPA: methyltransferase domain-containing protein [Anaerolineae bacterium]|nr:methyltransferase domain-containing protein [Anaerolineae bacterium]